MKTSAFLAILRRHPDLPVVFRVGDQAIASRYHLTEVKRVAYETMDCGAQTHRWSETHFELWVPPLAGALPDRAHLAAGKLLRIIDRVEQELPLAGDTPARILASLGDHPAALHDITAVQESEGRLWVELAPDRTRCKAAERRLAALTGGCCGVEAEPAPGCASAAASCGVPSSATPAGTTCCA